MMQKENGKEEEEKEEQEEDTMNDFSTQVKEIDLFIFFGINKKENERERASSKNKRNIISI